VDAPDEQHFGDFVIHQPLSEQEAEPMDLVAEQVVGWVAEQVVSQGLEQQVEAAIQTVEPLVKVDQHHLEQDSNLQASTSEAYHHHHLS